MPLVKFADNDLVQIDLPTEGEWVKVKRRLGMNDERAIQSRILAGQRIASGDAVDIDLGPLVGAAEFATLEVVIREWNLVDPTTGKKAPLTYANLRALDEESLDVIKTKLNELYPATRTDDERKNSSEPGPEPSKTAARSRRS